MASSPVVYHATTHRDIETTLNKSQSKDDIQRYQLLNDPTACAA